MNFFECSMQENRDVAEAITTVGFERLNLQIYYIDVTNLPGLVLQVSQWASKRWCNKPVIWLFSGSYNDIEINSDF